MIAVGTFTTRFEPYFSVAADVAETELVFSGIDGIFPSEQTSLDSSPGSPPVSGQSMASQSSVTIAQ